MREEKKKDNTNEKKGVSFEALSSLDAPVSFWKGIPFGLQHVMAMFVANLAPIFLVASAANMSAEQSATIIQAGLLVAGLGTCLQLYGVWLIGSRLPMVTGISFTYCGCCHVDRPEPRLRRGRRRGCAWWPVGGCAWFDGQVLASLRAADRIRDCSYVDWFLTAFRWCHQFPAAVPALRISEAGRISRSV